MADKSKGTSPIVEGQEMEGHGDKTQPAGIQSPATFVPLNQEPKSVNQKTDAGKRGKES
jgi:hypothetical protein